MSDFIKVDTFWNDRIFAKPSAATAAVITLLAASKPGFAGVFALAVVANNIRRKRRSRHSPIVKDLLPLKNSILKINSEAEFHVLYI